MKTLVVLSIIVTVALAAPDWKAIQGKYEEMAATWNDNSKNALGILEKEVDEETLKSSEQALTTFLNTGIELYKATVSHGIEAENLTPEQAEEFYNKLSELFDRFDDDIKTLIQGKLKPESQTKLYELWDSFKNYFSTKTKEAVELLKA